MPGFTGTGPSNIGVEFHRQHRWLIEDLGIPISGTRTRRAGPAVKQKAALYAQSLQLPALEFDQEIIKSPSLEYKVAKRAKWKNVTIKFYDVWGLYKEFEAWQSRIWNPNSGIQAANIYKGEPKFVLYDGKGKVKQRYTLKGAYPQSITHGELSYTSSDVKLLVVTYSYDFAEIKLFDDPPKAPTPTLTGSKARKGGSTLQGPPPGPLPVPQRVAPRRVRPPPAR